MKKIWQLFVSFFKVGLFTFGGGISMLPLIIREVINKHAWISEEELLDIVTIAESTPGVIAVNMATYVGYKVSKFWGSLVATLAVCLPSFVIIMLITLFYDAFRQNEVVSWAFLGIRSAVAILILNAVIKLTKHCPKNLFSLIVIIIVTSIALFFPHFSTIYIIFIGFIVGIIWYTLISKPTSKPKEEQNAN